MPKHTVDQANSQAHAVDRSEFGGFHAEFEPIRAYRHIPATERVRFVLTALTHAIGWEFIGAHNVRSAFESHDDLMSFLAELSATDTWTEPAHFSAFIRAGIYPDNAGVYDYAFLSERIRECVT